MAPSTRSNRNSRLSSPAKARGDVSEAATMPESSSSSGSKSDADSASASTRNSRTPKKYPPSQARSMKDDSEMSQLEQDVIAKQRGRRPSSQRGPGAVAVSGGQMSQMEQDIRAKQMGRRPSSSRRLSGGGGKMSQTERDILAKDNARGSTFAGYPRPGAQAVSGGDINQMEQVIMAKEIGLPGFPRPGAQAVSGGDISQMERSIMDKERGVPAGRPGAQAVSGGDINQMERSIMAKERGLPAGRPGAQAMSSGDISQMEHNIMAKERRLSAGRPGAQAVAGGDITQMEQNIMAKELGLPSGRPGAQAMSGGDISQMEHNIMAKERGGPSLFGSGGQPGAMTMSGADINQMEQRIMAKERGGSAPGMEQGYADFSARSVAQMEQDLLSIETPSRGGYAADSTRSVSQMEEDLLSKENARGNGQAAVSAHSMAVGSRGSSLNQIEGDLRLKHGAVPGDNDPSQVAESKYHGKPGMRSSFSKADDYGKKGGPSKLVEAKPVEPEVEAAEMEIECHEVDLEEQQQFEERQEETKRKRKVWACKMGAGFCLLLIGIAVGVYFGVTSSSDGAAEVAARPSVPQTQAPSPAPTPFIIDLPDATTETIQRDPDSPQARAYRWIANDPHLEDYVGQEFRLIQRFALATLYYSLDGDNWNLKDGWLDYETSECDWAFKGGYGLPALEMRGQLETRLVSVLVGGAVTGEPFDWSEFTYTPDRPMYPPAPICNPKNEFVLLKIHKQNVYGTIPDELALISSLVLMDISYNERMIGSIPTTFGTMKNMKFIMMEETGISGTIPSEIGGMESMRALSTSGTRFWKGTTIPTEVGQLKHLSTLLLAFSGIEGTIPSELGSLSQALTIFDVSSHANDEAKIGGTLPSELGALTRMHVFTCGNCQLEGALPSELGRMAELELLSIGNSQDIIGTIPTSFGGLTSLKYLQISQSQLSGQIPTELGSSTDLVRMYLMNNKLSGNLPSELGRMSNLETAYINENEDLTGPFPPEVVAGWSESLIELDISDTMITGLMSPKFCSLPGFFEFDCTATTCGCNCVCV